MSETTSGPSWVTLASNERVVWNGSPSLRAAAGSLVISLLLVGIGIGGIMIAFGRGEALFNALSVVLVGIGTVGIVGLLLRRWSVQYVLTSEKIYKKSGLLSCTVRTIWLSRIQHTTFTQTVRERLLSYGTIDIETAGGNASGFRLANVSDPEYTSALLTEHGATKPRANERTSNRTVTAQPHAY